MPTDRNKKIVEIHRIVGELNRVAGEASTELDRLSRSLGNIGIDVILEDIQWTKAGGLGCIVNGEETSFYNVPRLQRIKMAQKIDALVDAILLVLKDMERFTREDK